MSFLNDEEHFAQSPLGVDIPRSTFDRSFNWKGSSKTGYLYCNFIDEMLPGDTVDLDTTMLTRMTTPLFPVMDDCYIDQYFFSVPNRLLWDHWKEFCGENNESSWIPSTVYTIPTINADSSAPLSPRQVNDYAHQMGISVDTYYGSQVNALPFRALRLIWNEWFRDQNTEAPQLLNTSDTESDLTLFSLLPVCRVHDLFGSCLPGPQKGNPVQLAFTGYVPVLSGTWSNVSGLTETAAKVEALSGTLTVAGGNVHGVGLSDGVVPLGQGQGSVSDPQIKFNNLYAGLDSIDPSDGLGMFCSVNDLRLAVQTQKILEKMAIGGSRYTEQILAQFGVHSPDARQQRPELIGHKRWQLNMQEVAQNSASVSGQTPLGTVGAYSKTFGVGDHVNHSFTEHCYLIGLFCIRHNRTYSQGIPKMFLRRDKLDFYWPALDHISEQPIYRAQICSPRFSGEIPTTEDFGGVFGYNEAWADYRYKPSINTGLMDPTVSGSLGKYWTYGDFYTAAPTLSSTWMHEGQNEVQRTLAVQDEDQFIHDFNFKYVHSRPMSTYSVPGLVDHF